MNIKSFTLCAALVMALAMAPAASAADVSASEAGEQVTYAKDISRLIQNHCQECHQPNGIGPFSLMNYRQAKAWSRMIKEVVLDGRMPPWHAHPDVGEWSNDRSLSDEEKEMVAKWADSGAPRGNPEDMPEPREFHDRWRIGEPDVIFEMPEEVTVEPTGVVPYKYFVSETNFKEDKWIQAAECMPGNPKVVHHIIMFVRGPGENMSPASEAGQGFLDAFAPGGVPMDLPEGQARLIPAGSKLIWQMHYTPTGKLETDRSKFGIKFADGPIKQEMATNEAINFNFEIPAGHSNYRVDASLTFDRETKLHSLAPHMHYRGKDFKYTLIYPDGREQLLLDVPNYDFNWQTTYHFEEPVMAPKGAKLECVAHFDNSADNPYNPDPTKSVRWGEQTWEEMMIGFFHFSYPTDGDIVAKSGSVVERKIEGTD